MSVLCVAEKPSISNEISRILSGGQRQHNTATSYIKNYEFDYPQTRSHFIVTCVCGHITSTDFLPRYNNWNDYEPGELFEAETHVYVKDDKKAIERNLLALARRVETLMIWTDCDREGEHIGMEIANVCRTVKPNIRVLRARFSAIIAQQIHRAAQHPVELDRRLADAVEARIILDLKIGAAFTRLQTLTLRPDLNQPNQQVLSYGPCQFPTLGFVVERFIKVKDFRPETFWYIHLELTRHRENGDTEVADFKWGRGHIFDNHIGVSLYTRVLENSRARVLSVMKKEAKKWKPLPLTTVELQKAGSRLLRMSPKKVLDTAESLYQKGFVSYPRTETDQFDAQFDLMSLIGKQTVDPAWGDFARRLQNGEFSAPRKGRNNDKAHPPIHPTAHASNLTAEQKKVYEFIVRRYLACCSKDAFGMETVVNVLCGGEEFSTSGLIVLEKNYLEVYPYDKWSSRTIPVFEQGEEFDPSICTLKDGRTSAPKYLTEADLVTLMDKNGIGTDATIAQHIETIVSRDYILERMEGATKYLVPTTLGLGLVEGYSEIGLPKCVSKPVLRRETERRMVQVCEGTTGKAEMIRVSLEQYREMYQIARREFAKVANTVRRYIRGNGDAGNGEEQHPDNGPPRDGGGGGGNNRGNVNGGPSAGPRGGARGGGPRPPTSRSRRSTINSDNDDPLPPPHQPRAPAAAPRSKPPLRSRANADRTPSNRSSIVNCECGIPAIKTLTTRGISKGRPRWGCGKADDPDACMFFKWVFDDSMASQPDAGPSAVPAKRPYMTTEAPSDAGEESRQCTSCGKDAAQRTVTKESANKGRRFWKCVDSQTPQCELFFEWADEPARPKGGLSGSASMGARTTSAATGGAGQCFKCNEEGHWAIACPNGDSGMNKRPRSFGTAPGSLGANIRCFKCEELGHFALDCTNSGGSSSKSNATPAGSGDCYKCGESGHWAKDCPGEGRTASSSSYKGSGPSQRGGRGGGRGGRGGRGGGASKKGKATKKKSAFAAADSR